jgi:hypothetical protein
MGDGAPPMVRSPRPVKSASHRNNPDSARPLLVHGISERRGERCKRRGSARCWAPPMRLGRGVAMTSRFISWALWGSVFAAIGGLALLR